jgi:putative hemolysin
MDVEQIMGNKQLQANIDKLPASCHLFSQDYLSVYCAKAQQIPAVLHEIGRLRTIAFSKLKGIDRDKEDSDVLDSEIDLDEYDELYSHLFVWNKRSQEIISTYRLGFSDKIIAQAGASSLYTASLFHLQSDFFKYLGPAIELSRAFVKPQYQKNHTPLLLLFRGIGQIVYQEPQYRYLFGLVSISKNYSLASRQTIVAYLQKHNKFELLTPYATPYHPAEYLKNISLSDLLNGINNIEDLKLRIKNLESGKLSLPILMVKYLKFNTKLVNYGIDPNFGDCLDLLCVTDLKNSDPKLLEQYTRLKW